MSASTRTQSGDEERRANIDNDELTTKFKWGEGSSLSQSLLCRELPRFGRYSLRYPMLPIVNQCSHAKCMMRGSQNFSDIVRPNLSQPLLSVFCCFFSVVVHRSDYERCAYSKICTQLSGWCLQKQIDKKEG